jgi:hypothetical protein
LAKLFTPHGMKTQALSCFVAYLAFVLCRTTHADPFDHWSLLTTGLPSNATAIAYGHGRYVAIGSAGLETGWISSSTDLANWTAATCQDQLCTPRALYALTFAQNRFVAVGNYGWVYTSTNGINWRLEVVPPSDSSLVDVTYGDGTFVTLGDVEACPCGFVATSQNATNWNAIEISDIRYLRGIAHGKARFVAVGSSDFAAVPSARNIITSTNAFATWSSIAVTETNELFAVAYGNDVFVAAGQEHYSGNARILVSGDGRNWNTPTLPTTNALRNVSFVEGTFLATGNSGTLLTSTNGIEWQLRPAFTTNVLGRAILGIGRILTIAGPSNIAASDPLLSLQIAIGAQPQIIVFGLEGRSYRIEATENVGSSVWQDLGTYVLYTSPTIWGDGTPLPNARFYRAVLLP